MNPGDEIQFNDRPHIVVMDLGEKVAITSATEGLKTEVFAVPRRMLFDADPD